MKEFNTFVNKVKKKKLEIASFKIPKKQCVNFEIFKLGYLWKENELYLIGLICIYKTGAIA